MFVDPVSNIFIPSEFYGYTFQKVVKSAPTYVLYRAVDELGQPVVIYFFETPRLDKIGITEAVKSRLEKMKSVVHPNVASVISVHSDENVTFMVAEDFLQTNLEDYILMSSKLSENEVLRIAKDLFDAFTYLHGKGICHGDLIPGNILFDEEMNPKISNFAFSQQSLTAVHTRETSQLNFIPPEVLTETGFNPAAADMWALGVIVYVMATGLLPFNQKNQIKQITQMSECNYAMPFPINENISKILLSCIVADPAKRASAARVSIDLKNVKVEPYRSKIAKRGVTQSSTFIAGMRHSKIESLAMQGKIQFRRKASSLSCGFDQLPKKTIKSTQSTFF